MHQKVKQVEIGQLGNLAENETNIHNYLYIPFCDVALMARSGKRHIYYHFDWVCAAHLE